MKQLLLIAFFFQKVLLNVAYWSVHFLSRRKTEFSWVVGVDEVAGNVNVIAQVIEGSFSVSFSINPFYDYSYSLKSLSPIFKWFWKPIRIVVGPLLLGYLVNKAGGFFYLGSEGFLLSHFDQREYEFRFIKKRAKRLVCFFCGTDIRSPKLSREFARKANVEVIADYQVLVDLRFNSEEFEREKQYLARVAETYADIIFNAPVDQIGYFTREVQPFMYFFPDNFFSRCDAKFNSTEKIKVVHAPSSPIIKGTPLVRAAILRLKTEGYVFDYVELVNVKNSVVLKELKSAHIAVNEFYSFVPGLFGVEALASHCALVTSADAEYEKVLPAGSNRAWFVTRSYEVYDHLKALLDEPSSIKNFADAGYDWACQNASQSVSGRRLNALLKAVGTSQGRWPVPPGTNGC